jgi:hypothetical protein
VSFSCASCSLPTSASPSPSRIDAARRRPSSVAACIGHPLACIGPPLACIGHPLLWAALAGTRLRSVIGHWACVRPVLARIGRWALGVGHRALRIGHRALGIGHWASGIRHWALGIGLRASGIGQHRALGIGHWESGIEHWALGIGHWALGIRHRASGVEHWALGIGHGAMGIGHWATKARLRSPRNSRHALRLCCIATSCTEGRLLRPSVSQAASAIRSASACRLSWLSVTHRLPMISATRSDSRLGALRSARCMKPCAASGSEAASRSTPGRYVPHDTRR